MLYRKNPENQTKNKKQKTKRKTLFSLLTRGKIEALFFILHQTPPPPTSPY